jgi:AcrR family transcriptional regulator
VGIPKRLSRAESAEKNGRRLLDAARKVFVERGYNGATLEDVARAAGFTKGVVYARYESKGELFLALLAERIEHRIEQLDTIDDARALWDQQLRRLPGDRDWLLAVTEFRITAARDTDLNARYAELHERLVQATGAAIARATRGRSLALPPVEAARLFHALATGMLIEHVGSGARFPERLSVTASELLLAGLRAS